MRRGRGLPGRAGRTIITVSGAPLDTVGTDGDYAYDPATTFIYGPKAGGAWPPGVKLQGSAGLPGAAGPAGAEALQAGVVSLPTPQNAVLRYPATGFIGPDHSLFILEAACHKRDIGGAKTNAFRKSVWWVQFYGELGAQVYNVSAVQISGGWTNSTAPLTAWGAGTTNLAVTAAAIANNQWYLVFALTGPTPAQAPSCSWAAKINPLGGLTAPV